MTKPPVEVGQVLTHPVHGPTQVIAVGPYGDREVVQPDGTEQIGHRITVVFDRAIEGVAQRHYVGGQSVSKLVFHSWYLRNLK